MNGACVCPVLLHRFSVTSSTAGVEARPTCTTVTNGSASATYDVQCSPVRRAAIAIVGPPRSCDT